MPLALSSWNNIRVVSLDLDNTLWDVGPPLERAEASVRAWLGEACPAAARTYTLERVLEVRAAVEASFPERRADLSYVRREVFRRILAAADCDCVSAEELFQVFFAARNDVELFPGVVDALASLSRRYSLVALTNGNADLDVIGLSRFFDYCISAARVGAPKPARAMFAAVLDASGVDAQHVVHVGDDPEHDVAGAQAAGMKTIWVNRSGQQWRTHAEPPDAEVACVTDLAAGMVDP